MSRFDFLANRRSTIYENCVQAEQSSDISVQMLKIRQVMEYIVKRLLADNNYDDYRDLFSGINTLDDGDIFDEDISTLFYQTSIITNKNIHGEGSRSTYANDVETAMNNLVEIVIWYEYHYGDNRFEHSGFTARDFPVARRHLGSEIVTDELYIDVNVNPLQIMGSFDTADEPINILEQDVFETEAEYESRIASMEPVHIGYAILDSRQGDGYTNIHFLQHHLDRNRAVRFVQAPVYFFTAEMGTDTVIDGELVARLVVHDHQVYLDYTRVFLRGDNEDIPISFICWDKIDYESDREYKARINALPILPLALCKPVRREYNIENQTLPFQVQPFVYVQTSIPTTLIVPCPRDFAKTICQGSQPLTIFGKISQDNAPLEYSIWSKTLGVIYNNHEALEQAKREQAEKERKEKEEQKDKSKQQYELGNRYWNDGEYEKALECYRVASEYGHAWAKRKLKEVENPNVQFDIGYYFYQRNNYQEAVKWYRKAAEQGNATAQNNLGYCYYNGLGVAQDYTEAVKWYKKSAEQGNTVAQTNLGDCYDKGQGIVQNYTEAVKWYRKSAEQGDADAQNSLGNCYYNGQGVAQDYTEAVKWYRKAAEQGNVSAKNNLKQIIEEKQL